MFKKFVKYERNFLTFDFLDKDNKQIGGKIKVQTSEINLSQLATYNYRQYVYFTGARLVFAKFDSE